MPADELPTSPRAKGLPPEYTTVPWLKLGRQLGGPDPYTLGEPQPDAPPSGA